MLITEASTSFISVDGHAEENRTESVCTHWFVRIGKSEAEVTIASARRISKNDGCS